MKILFISLLKGIQNNLFEYIYLIKLNTKIIYLKK